MSRTTDVWQQCDPLRTTQGKEFRYYLVRLKLLLAEAYQIHGYNLVPARIVTA